MFLFNNTIFCGLEEVGGQITFKVNNCYFVAVERTSINRYFYFVGISVGFVRGTCSTQKELCNILKRLLPD